MNALPWYKSPVYIGVVVNLVAGLVNILNLQEIVTLEIINNTVAAIFTTAGVVAAVIAEHKRRKSDVQPLTLTSSGAKAKSQSGFASIPMLIIIAILAAFTFTGCANTPDDIVRTACSARSEYQVERCVKSVAETYEVYQQRGLELVQDPAAPEDVKSLVRKADALATPAVLEMLESAKAYMQVRDDLKAGTTTEEKLLIASQNAYAYVAIAEERINALIAALSGKPSPGITVEDPVAAPAAASVSVR